jgi:hypothetical protein
MVTNLITYNSENQNGKEAGITDYVSISFWIGLTMLVKDVLSHHDRQTHMIISQLKDE